MNSNERERGPAMTDEEFDDGPVVGLVDLLTWIGEGKRLIATVTLAAGVIALIVALLLPPMFTARATLLAPDSQQSGGSAAALAALGALSGLAGGLAPKTSDELYVALLTSDSVDRALDQRFELKQRYEVKTYEELRKALPDYIRVSADKKSGVIAVEVDDEDPKFAAALANAHADEVTKLLGRLAVSEAQRRRVFFAQQLHDTKEDLIKAEQNLVLVQNKTGVIVLDKQAEALINAAAQVRAMIAEREVQLKVLRTSATPQNPQVMQLNSELKALRAELARMESSQGATTGSAVSLPVGKLPEVGLEYVRAKRELTIQEALLESMLKQYEIAKLDEAKEGPQLQVVDVALPPDRKSKPKRALIVLASALLALLASCAFVVVRRYAALAREQDPDGAAAWEALGSAWRLRRG
jgi:uncharacterized protein involved in exopolysaccharide biosynthesis